MADDPRFDADLHDALQGYANSASALVDPDALITRLEDSGALRRPSFGRIPVPSFSTLRLLAVVVVLALVFALLVSGFGRRPGHLFLALGGDAGITIAEVDNGAERLLSIGATHDPRWSGDGAWVAAWTDEPHTVVVTMAAKPTVDTRRVPALAFAWRPGSRAGTAELAIVRPDGIVIVQTADGTVRWQAPDVPPATGPLAWAPDGRFLAWASGGEPFVVTFDADVTGVVTHVRQSENISHRPISALAVRPDGRALVTVAPNCTNECAVAAYQLDVDPDRMGMSLISESVAATTDLTWDAHGSTLLATRIGASGPEVDAIDPATDRATVLVTNDQLAAASGVRARWMWAANLMILETGAPGGVTDLWVADQGGSHPRRLATNRLGGDVLFWP